jgi:hypothetical protein
MNNKYFIYRAFILLLITFNCSFVLASNADSTRSNTSIVLNYWGTVASTPGLKLGIEQAFLQSSKYAVIGSASLLLNRKPDIYTSAGFSFGSTLRRTGKCGLYLEHGIILGYLGNYYDFDVYRTNSDGDIVNVGRKWKSSFLFGYSVGIGYDFSKKTKTDLQLFFKPGIFYCLPNKANFYYVNNYSIEIGLVLHPKWLNINRNNSDSDN